MACKTMRQCTATTVGADQLTGAGPTLVPAADRHVKLLMQRKAAAVGADQLTGAGPALVPAAKWPVQL